MIIKTKKNKNNNICWKYYTKPVVKFKLNKNHNSNCGIMGEHFEGERNWRAM